MNEQRRRWCIFTSAGENNNIRGWLEGGATAKGWDLIVAYYGDGEQEFSKLSEISTHAFRSKGGKFQNLKKFVAQNSSFLERYSYIWICDDDIRMSASQITEAFSITELYNFWIAQPAFRPEGKNSFGALDYAGCQYDYRIVNFVEVGVPIFRQDKLAEFLRVYDGSLTGYGIDFWYMNVFGAHKLGLFAHFLRRYQRFAVIDAVQVTNPHREEKGGPEIDRLEQRAVRRSKWAAAMAKYNLVEFPVRVFACHKVASNGAGEVGVRVHDVCRQIAIVAEKMSARLKARVWNALTVFRFDVFRAFRRGASFGRSSAIRAQPRTLAERLGYESDTRLLIVHADDFALSHAVNTAIIAGMGTGLINSGSVMVPSPWFPDVIAFAHANPDADLGVHLTLTSEGAGYRWGPTAPRERVRSLIDQQGYFHRTWTYDTPINAREVEIELRAQIEKAYSAGLRPTHLDSHQYRLQMKGRALFKVYLQVGHEYDLPVFVARNWFTQFPYLQRSLVSRDVVIDHTVTVGVETSPHEWAAFYRRALERLQSGVTQFVIHPGFDSAELRGLSGCRPSWGAAWRQRDFDYFTSEEFRHLLVKHNIKLITWRDIVSCLRGCI